MADTAEASADVPSRGLNGHVAEEYMVAHMSAEGHKGARKGITGVGGANDVVSGAASGDGGTGMLEGTTNGDGELEGAELVALDISLESVSFY